MIVSKDKITSRHNRMIVETGKLGDRKVRGAERCFCLDGIKLFYEAVEKGIAIERIFVTESRAERLLADLEKKCRCDALKNATVYTVSDDVFAKLSHEQAPEGLLATARFPAFHAEGQRAFDMLSEACEMCGGVLLLESVRDPGNVGTILRSAAAFGISCVAMSTDCADVYNAKTVRGAMGALFSMRIAFFSDITEAIGALRQRGRRVFAAALDPTAQKLGAGALKRNDCIAIGNEGHGLSESAIAACDHSLYIPMEAGSESLNAAVAASVILWNMYSN